MSTSTESPTGLDLRPQWPKAVQISRRAGILAVAVLTLVLLLLFYGIYRRQQQQQRLQLPYAVGGRTKISPSQIPTEITSQSNPGETLAPPQSTSVAPPRAQVGNLATPSNVYPRPAADASAPALPPPYAYRASTADDRLRSLADEREQQAIDAPTAVRADGGTLQGVSFNQAIPPAAQADLPSLAALGRLSPAASSVSTAAQVPPLGATNALADRTSQSEEFGQQNLQGPKQAFFERTRTRSFSNYLPSTRTAPLGKFELKAGWNIPAVLEQPINSDLPGEVRALVRENVYDTATGRYLLIPQGSRLIGVYDSQIAYGQNGVQAAWYRIIYPDGSSVKLEGMVGEDAQGNAGLRDKVDNHYKRLIGFAALTSLFSAGFELSQPRSSSILRVPSTGEIVGGAVGREISQMGVEITRRNLNVQPTIKIPVGYRFLVRVNRDILLASAYAAMKP